MLKVLKKYFGNRYLNVLIISFIVVWTFIGLASYIEHLFSILMLLTAGCWFLFLIIVITQIIYFILEKSRQFWRLRYAGVISVLMFLFLLYPLGLINWEWFEQEDYLVAQYEGTANCQHIIRLKPEQRYTYTSVCFGRNIYSGTYLINQDTIHFFPSSPAPYLTQNTNGIFSSSDKQQRYFTLSLFESYSSKRNIGMLVVEFDTTKINLRKQLSLKAQGDETRIE